MYKGMFNWWVQSVMPVVFDDSLSYYEVLAKLTKYIEGLTGDVEQIEKILGTIEGIEDVTEFTRFLESISNEIGILSDLSTSNKNDLVSAINEVAQKANQAYVKPTGGIPESDLSQGVKDKLNDSGGASVSYIINNKTLKTAPNNNSPADLGLGTYSVPQGGIPWDTLSEDVQNRIEAGGGGTGGTKDYTDLNNKPQINGHTLNAGNNTVESLGIGTYSKPATGIPESDLSEDVQEKLNTSGGIADSENTFVATKDYEAGELFYINGVLYKAKYKILNGTNLIPGNNIEVTDLNAEIERINNDIDALQSGSGPDSWNLSAEVESEASTQITNFFEYFNCIGGENYNFILDPVLPTAGYEIDIFKRDGTVARGFDNTTYPNYLNRQRFTFTPTDTGEYYCTIRKSSGGSTDTAHARVTIEYTQSQGISELWNRVNAASSVVEDVDALQDLVEEHQTQLDALDNIPEEVEMLENYIDELSRFDGSFELGNIYLSNSGWSYTNSASRLRTPKGYAIRLKQGEVIGLTNYTNAVYIAGWLDYNGEYHVMGNWRSQDYTILQDGYYALVVRYATEEAITDVDDLISIIKLPESAKIQTIDSTGEILLENMLAKVILPASNVSYATIDGTTFSLPVGTTIISNSGETVTLTEDNNTLNIVVSSITIGIAFNKNQNGLRQFNYMTETPSSDDIVILLSNYTAHSTSAPVKYNGQYLCNFPLVVNENSHNWINEYINSQFTIIDPSTGNVNIVTNSRNIVFSAGVRILRSTLCNVILSEDITVTIGDLVNTFLYFDFDNNTITGRTALTFIRGQFLIGIVVAPTTYSPSTEWAFISNGCPYTINGEIKGFKPNLTPVVKSINHRGYNIEAPENTIPAYKLSCAKGFDCVETDIAFTSDKIPVLLHDRSINRVAGLPATPEIEIKDITYAEALTYDLGNARYPNTRIATFEELLSLCRSLGLTIYAEIKTDYELTDEYAGILNNLVKSYGMENNVVWISFGTNRLQKMSNLNNNIPVGLVCDTITQTVIDDVTALITGGAKAFIDAAYSNITTSTIDMCKNAGIELGVWSVNYPQDIIDMPGYITMVTSDYTVASNVLYNNAIS